MSTVALVPAYRRADRVGATVNGLLALVDEVVVIDDGSADGGATAGAARSAGASVVALPVNRGKGGALAAGVAATPEADTYLLVDADTADTAAATAPLLAAVEDGADLAIGVLPPARGRGGFGTVRNVAAWGIRRACGFEAKAPLSGQRAVRASLLRSLEPADRFGVEAGMTIDAVRAGARVVEVPVGVDHAHTGRGVAGFSHRAAQGWDLLRALWPRLLAEPTRLLVLVGGAVVVAALLAAGGAAAVPTGAPLERAERVVLVAAPPTLRLDDIDDPGRPELTALAGHRGAVAAANVDVPGRSTWSSWATVGAGAEVRARPPSRPPDPKEPFLVRDVEEGQGRLGDALLQAGRTTGFVGPDPTSPVRLAVADSTGRIDRAATASIGVGGLVNRTRADLGAGASVVAVDASRLGSADFDLLLAELRSGAERQLLLVVTPADRGGSFGLRPLVASGPGAPAGRLLSPSTRRDGLVVLSDVAPTILDVLGMAPAKGMVGRPLRHHSGPPDVPGLVADDRLARQRNTVWDPALLAVVPLHFAVYGWGWRRHRRRRERPDVHPASGEERTPSADPAGGPAPGRVRVAPSGVGPGRHPSTGPGGTADPGAEDAQPADSRIATSGVELGRDASGSAARADAGASWPQQDVAGPGDAPAGHTGTTTEMLRPLEAERPSGDGLDPVAASAATGNGGALPSGSVAGLRGGFERQALLHIGLGLVAWPLATWLVRAMPGTASLGRWAGLLAVAVDAAVVVLALRRGRGLAPLAVVLGATVALVTVDLGFGGPLQLSSAFGGAAHSTGRFTGLGNAAFAVYAASALLAVACGRRRAPWMVALLVLVALVDALPSLGGDVGGVLTLVPIFSLAVAALWGRLRWRTVVLAGAATVLVLGAALAVDLSRPADERTHLARFVTGGGTSSSVGGKIGQNLGTYAAIPLLAAVVAITVGFALLLWRRRFLTALPSDSPARIGVAAALGVALVGNVLNDSGPIVTLLGMSIIAPSLVVRSAATEEPPPKILPPLPDPRSLSTAR